MADMRIEDADDFSSRRVVLQEEQHSEVISLCSPSLAICSCYASKLNMTLLFAPLP